MRKPFETGTQNNIYLYMRIALLALLASFYAPLAYAGEIVVSREGSGYAIYVRMPYAEVAPLFGQAPEGFTDEQGRLAVEKLSNGTFDAADDLIADVGFELGGAPVAFEAMSMMVHQAATPVPFDDPIAAQVAIAVCNVPLPEGPIDPTALTWIGGWFAYPVASDEALRIQFPQTGRDATEFSVVVFDDGEFEQQFDVRLKDGGALAVPDAPGWWRTLIGG
ncbi:MAG: hypothetical protein AAF755_15020 [Pseudomonadota bacterium]